MVKKNSDDNDDDGEQFSRFWLMRDKHQNFYNYNFSKIDRIFEAYITSA